MQRDLVSLGWTFRVSLLAAAALFFVLASVTGALAQTEVKACSDFDSQEQAQTALDNGSDNTELVQSLDSDGDDEACEDFDFSAAQDKDDGASAGSETANGAGSVKLTCEQLIELVENDAASGQYVTEISQRCEGSANVISGTVPGKALADTGGPLPGLLLAGLLLTGGGLLLRSTLRRG